MGMQDRYDGPSGGTAADWAAEQAVVPSDPFYGRGPSSGGPNSGPPDETFVREDGAIVRLSDGKTVVGWMPRNNR